MKMVKIKVESQSHDFEVNKINKKEADVIVKYMYKLFKGKAKRFEVVGSYRRGKKKLYGDIEFLVSSDLSNSKILKILENSKLIDIEKVLRKGKQILSLIVSYKGKKIKVPFFQLEFYRTPISSWGAALLTRTGPASFNIYMRSKAIFKKWKLNEKGLFDSKGKKIAGKTEEEIFEKLGIPYLTPEEREVRFK